MSPENTAALLQGFPHLYRGYYKSPQETCMARGFACGDGWFDLIWWLSVDLQAHIRAHPELQEFEVVQVKEKFNSLRYYYRGGDSYTWDRVARAEKESVWVCPRTGERRAPRSAEASERKADLLPGVAEDSGHNVQG